MSDRRKVLKAPIQHSSSRDHGFMEETVFVEIVTSAHVRQSRSGRARAARKAERRRTGTTYVDIDADVYFSGSRLAES